MAVANIDARAAQQQLQNNNFLVSLDRNNNLRRVILDPEELDYRRPSSRSMDIGISALPPVSTALAILQVQFLESPLAGFTVFSKISTFLPDSHLSSERSIYKGRKGYLGQL